MHRDAFAEDRVADLRARWTPEATAAAVAFLESRRVAYDLPTIEQGAQTYLDLRGLRIEQTQVDKAKIADSRIDFASFKNCEVGLQNIEFHRDATPRAMVRVCRSL